LRPGSISAVVHRCGKSYCHCAKPKDWARTADSCSAQGARQVRSGDPFQPDGFPQSAGRGFRIPPLSGAQCRARHHQRKDLPPATPGAGTRGLDSGEKNSCCDPSGSRAGNRRAAASDIHRTSQDWRNRPGSGGDGLTSSLAAGRCRGPESTAPTGVPGEIAGAGDADEGEVRTHEVPQDDVPGEYSESRRIIQA